MEIDSVADILISADDSCITSDPDHDNGDSMKKSVSPRPGKSLISDVSVEDDGKSTEMIKSTPRPVEIMKLPLKKHSDSDKIGESARKAKKPKMKTKTKTKTETKPKPKTETKPKPKPKTETKPKPKHKKTETEVKTEINPKPETETKPKTKPEAKMTVKQRITKILKNNKAKNTKTRPLYKLQ